MASPDVQDIYRHIKHTAENIVSVTKGVATSVTVPSIIPPGSGYDYELEFAQTNPIFASLVDDGLPIETSEKLSNLYSKMSTHLQDYLRDNFKSTLLKMTQLPVPVETKDLPTQLARSFRAAYEQKQTAWASEIRRMAFSRLENIRKQDKRSLENESASAHNTFNYSYTPVLETFFAQEQFPSRADKQYLARKAGMSYRQIHVWFQNRRSRTRKLNPGPSVCDSSQDDTDVEDFGDKMSTFSSRASSFTLVEDEHAFESNPPHHAFPGKYPPDFDDKNDPFPCRFGDFSSFPRTNWDRNCSVLPIRRDDAAVDIDELSEAFGKLRIRSTPISKRAEVDYPRAWGSYNPRPLSGCDVMAAYTTRPLSAPIPSFIRYPHQERDQRPCTVFRPQHRDLLQTGSNASSLHSHDTPSNYKFACKTKRVNKPRLPKRVPTNQPKLFATSKSRSEPLGLSSTDEADACTRGRTSTPLLERVAMVTRSASSSSSSDESLPSLTPSFSSSSSSEAQSPSSPAQGLPDESYLCFLPELSTTSIPVASQGLLADIPFSFFAPTDFNYDLISSKPFVDNAYDLAISQSQADPFLSLQLQPPPAIPQPLPFSFEFAPLTS